MAISQTDVDNLERAVATGELTVVYDGRSVTYRSIAELLRALDYAKAQIATASTAGGAVTQSFAAFDRG
jgi:hypothetical protein